MGADRKGPLAAFIVIAIIAVILLVTSVRSQAAAAGWLRGALPSAPTVVGAVGGGLDQIVERGTDLVRRSTPPAPTSPPAGTQPVTQPVTPDDGRAAGHHTPYQRVRESHARPAWKGHDDSAHDGAESARHDHGRHLGWSHGHGRGHSHGHGHGRHLGWGSDSDDD